MIQIKRGSTKSWHDTEVKLASGQPGYDKDMHQLKIGDGESAWVELPAIGGVDCIISTGSSENWSYQKFESGLARCWCTKKITTSVSTALGDTKFFKEDNAVSAMSYPISFKTPPCETATLQSSNGIMWLASKTKNTSDTSSEYAIISATQTLNADCMLSIQVEGFWK